MKEMRFLAKKGKEKKPQENRMMNEKKPDGAKYHDRHFGNQNSKYQERDDDRIKNTEKKRKSMIFDITWNSK